MSLRFRRAWLGPGWLALAALVCSAALGATAATSLSSTGHLWGFETTVDGWQPRAKTIVVSRVSGLGATSNSHACLRVQGRMPDGWNYALSGHVPMQGGGLYRLGAWLRVDQPGASTLAPFLKCEFIGSAEDRYLGQVTTSHYDVSKLGTWQRLEAEFQAPASARQCWLALEKSTDGPAEIDARLDEIRLETIPRLSALEQYRLKPWPAALEKRRGAHPRLYLDPARVAQLRGAIQGTHAPLWKELREQADRLARRGPPAYRERDDSSGDEQLWQRDVGNAMPVLAMAWVLTRERPYLEAARQWALASCSYKTWGLGRTDGMDLAAGHQLFGLALVYDWCHADLDEAARRTIRDTLVRRTSAMFEAAATGKVWWQRSYLQNHLWVNVCGMAAAGFALFDEVDNAAMWIGLPLEKSQKTMSALGSDGASHEGLGYWEYGVEYLLKFMDLARTLLDVNLHESDWWRQTARYAQYLSLPRRAWTRANCIVDIADCPRSHWYGPDYLLRGLARAFRDRHAQWLAQEMDEANVASAGAPWLNLVWFDPTVPAQPPTALPTLRHFGDLGIVSARSDWSGDESLVVFKCGPFIGHRAVQEFSYDPGGGHVHPDANHFVLFGAGEWLIRDDGYRAKWSGQHNTLLVDGQGQLGEGKMWFDGSQALRLKSRPRILHTESNAACDYFVGDATEAYPRFLGLRRYVRHLFFLKPDVLLVGDDIALDQPREIELRFHPESRAAVREGQTFRFQNQRSTLRLDLLTPDKVAFSAEDIGAADRHGAKTEKMFTVRLNTKAKAWRNIVALSWSRADQQPSKVMVESKGDVWQFSLGGRRVALDWQRILPSLEQQGGTTDTLRPESAK